MHNILLLLLIFVVVSFSHVELHPFNADLKNIGSKLSSATLKRAGLANPFVFTYTTNIPSEVERCFDYAGNEILAKLIEFRFPIKAKSVIFYQSHEVYSESVLSRRALHGQALLRMFLAARGPRLRAPTIPQHLRPGTPLCYSTNSRSIIHAIVFLSEIILIYSFQCRCRMPTKPQR